MISNRHSVTLLSVLTVLFLTTCKPEKEEPKPLTAPVLTTMEAGDITAISALSGGAISSDGGSPVTARGIVWSVSHNPTLSDSISEEGTGIGSFTSDLTPLKYSTTYYIRAYATNSIGTTYGNEVTFNTKAAVPSDGLVGWWPFNGNANDESGNGNNGVVTEAIPAVDRLGFQGNSFEFPGKIVGNSSNFPSGNSERTISFWYKANTLGSIFYQQILGYGGGNCGQSLWLEFENQELSGTYEIQGHCSISRVITNYYAPANSTWRNITISFDGQFFRFFNDGDLVQTSSEIILDTGVNGTIFSFGRIPGGDGVSLYGDLQGDPAPNSFDGQLDDIAIYNRALTAEEIQKIYNGTGF